MASTLLWTFFHLWLNILAEITCFGDRLFYTHWWNAKRLDQYWRCWNIPVHNWLLRHVYFPVLGTGVGKTLAGLIVFVISAALHELIASGALRELRVWIFMGMLLQLPAIMLTSYLDKKIFKGSELGNVLFWFFFCIGPTNDFNAVLRGLGFVGLTALRFACALKGRWIFSIHIC